MVTKKRSKSPKKSTTKRKGKDKQVLTPIEKELLECARRGQPVLLYGGDSVDCTHLVGKIQLIRKAIRECGYDKREDIMKYRKGTAKVFDNIICHPLNDDELDKIVKKSRIKDMTWGYLDCEDLDAKSIMSKLSTSRIGYSVEGVDTYKINFDYINIKDPILSSMRDYYAPRIYDSHLIFIDNLSFKSWDPEDKYYYEKLAIVVKKRRFGDPLIGGWFVAYTHKLDDFPEHFRNQFKEISLDSEVKKIRKIKKEEKDNFNDVKLEITVDSTDTPLFDAIVSTNKVDKEKLPLEPGFLEPLHLLAKTVKDDKNDGWVYNKDLDRTCNEGANKAKYEITEAFKKKIGERAKGIIKTKHSMGKRLLIPKKNIKFKPIT